MRRHVSPALVISCIALAVALSGTGYAAFALPANSVGTSALKNNAVTHAKLAANAVTGSNVQDGSLSSADFKSGQIPGQTFYSASKPGDGVPLPTNADTTVASLALTAGTYVLIGRAELENLSGVAHVVRCQFSPSDSQADGIVSLEPATSTSLGISDPVALSASATTVAMTCHNYGGTTIAYTRVIEAIKVGTLTRQ